MNEVETAEYTPLRVGLHLIPPLVIKKDNGYHGFDIDLWEAICARLGLSYKYKELYLQDIFAGLEKKTLDVGISGLTVTYDREKIVDFSHPYLESGLSIVVNNSYKSSFVSIFKSLAKEHVPIWLASFLVFVIITAHIFWFTEKGFGTSEAYLEGILESVWFVIATITTVGYGDVVPMGVGGRIVGLLAMMFGVTLFGLFTAQVSSGLVLKRMRSSIVSPENLNGKTVGAIKGSYSIDILQKLGARILQRKNPKSLYSKLKEYRVDAVVVDTPRAMFDIESTQRDLIIAGDRFAEQHYAFAFPEGSRMREKINKEILKMQEDGSYAEIYKKWFGETSSTAQ